MSKNLEKLLKSIFYTPSHPGSFSSASQIQRILREKYKHNARVGDIQEWLNDQRAYSRHRPVKVNFERNPIFAKYIDNQWQSDLLFLPDLAKANDKIQCLLIMIDIVSRYAWVEPLKSKSGPQTTGGFETILSRASPRKPEKLQTDDGKEFFNSNFQDLCKRHGIHHFSTKSDTKAAVAERFVKTIKEKIYKYLDSSPSNNRYIDALQDLVVSYNNTHHSSINMCPAEVNNNNQGEVLRTLYGHLWAEDRGNSKKKLPFSVGDHVRLARGKSPFYKGYKGNWTEELFKIVQIKDSLPRRIYKVSDLKGEVLTGGLYEEQMLKVKDPTRDEFWQIDEVLRHRIVRRGKKRVKEYLVKWFGYPEEYNSWVPETDVKDFKKT
jgi:hypothetical protein